MRSHGNISSSGLQRRDLSIGLNIVTSRTFPCLVFLSFEQIYFAKARYVLELALEGM
jgi:hypothetical protein